MRAKNHIHVPFETHRILNIIASIGSDKAVKYFFVIWDPFY